MTFLLQFGLVFAIMLNLVWAAKFTRMLWKLSDQTEGSTELVVKMTETMCGIKIHIHLLYVLVFIMIVSQT